MQQTNFLTLFESLLTRMVELRASDLHCSVNTAPLMRINGLISERSELAVLDQNTLLGMAEAVLSTKQLQHLKTALSVDFSYSNNDAERFRLNFYHERGSLAFAIRWLEGEFQSFETLNLPPQIREVVSYKDGLVLVTGATGSGKSTTLASIIHEINVNRPCHILTIEDPIEFIHSNKAAVVHQREVGADVPSFSDAIRGAMREDPDVILLGEMRDLETMHAAITAAETGHLVFATLHTNDAVGVIDRLIGMFPGEEQNTIRQQLSMALRAVITQTLVQRLDKKGRVPVNEILFVNGAVSNLIREHNPSQIRSIIETSRALGNQTFEFALAKRVHEKAISKEQAMQLTPRTDQLNDSLRMLAGR